MAAAAEAAEEPPAAGAAAAAALEGRRERPQRPDWRRWAVVKTADGGGGGEDRTTAEAEATRTPAASRTPSNLRISCGLYEPTAMALDVRHMQLPIRPSSIPASTVAFSQLRLVSYAGRWKGGARWRVVPFGFGFG